MPLCLVSMAGTTGQETSVLFSLRELRSLEDDRVARERQARHDSELQKIAALEAQAIARRDAIEAQARIAREAELRVAREREAAERAARIAVEQTEASERARHQAALEEQRFAQELELRRAEIAKKRPTWMLAVTVIAAIAAAGLVVFAVQRQHESEAAVAGMEVAQREKAAAVAMAKDSTDKLAQLDKHLEQLDGEVRVAIRAVEIAQGKAAQDAAAAHLRQVQKDQADEHARAVQQRLDLEHKIRMGGVKIDDDCKNAALSKKCL